MSINPQTGTAGSASRVDTGMNLATGKMGSGPSVRVTEHLPYSAADGAPLHEDIFTQGHRWTEAPGKIHPGAGPGNSSW